MIVVCLLCRRSRGRHLLGRRRNIVTVLHPRGKEVQCVLLLFPFVFGSPKGDPHKSSRPLYPHVLVDPSRPQKSSPRGSPCSSTGPRRPAEGSPPPYSRPPTPSTVRNTVTVTPGGSRRTLTVSDEKRTGPGTSYLRK